MVVLPRDCVMKMQIYHQTWNHLHDRVLDQTYLKLQGDVFQLHQTKWCRSLQHCFSKLWRFALYEYSTVCVRCDKILVIRGLEVDEWILPIISTSAVYSLLNYKISLFFSCTILQSVCLCFFKFILIGWDLTTSSGSFNTWKTEIHCRSIEILVDIIIIRRNMVKVYSV